MNFHINSFDIFCVIVLTNTYRVYKKRNPILASHCALVTIMTKTPHEYIQVTYEYIRVRFCEFYLNFYFLTSFLEEKGLNNT